jgi:hypothetical protein
MCLATKPWGKVVDVGPENKKLKVGDRVVVPFTISCGECFFCRKGFFSGCERSNPNHKMAEKLWGAMARVLIGTSGWHYNSWRGPFFPKGLPLKCQLQYYASQFPTAELNGVFYRTPTPEAVRSWRDQTGRDFVFAWKASKSPIGSAFRRTPSTVSICWKTGCPC